MGWLGQACVTQPGCFPLLLQPAINKRRGFWKGPRKAARVFTLGACAGLRVGRRGGRRTEPPLLFDFPGFVESCEHRSEQGKAAPGSPLTRFHACSLFFLALLALSLFCWGNGVF